MSTPYAARSLPELPLTESVAWALTELLVAVNGFVYYGESTDAVTYTLRYLRAHPDVAEAILERKNPDHEDVI